MPCPDKIGRTVVSLALANQARRADNGYCNVPCSEGENTCGGANKCSPGEPCAFGACIT